MLASYVRAPCKCKSVPEVCFRILPICLCASNLFARQSELFPVLSIQQAEAEAYRLTASTTFAIQKRNWFRNRIWGMKDTGTALLFIGMHLACLAAPFTFSWQCLILWYVTYCITGCLGIAMSFHRQLSHHSFTTPKWLEYFFAYCGVMTIEVRTTYDIIYFSMFCFSFESNHRISGFHCLLSCNFFQMRKHLWYSFSFCVFTNNSPWVFVDRLLLTNRAVSELPEHCAGRPVTL